jgi:hypothetical protein
VLSAISALDGSATVYAEGYSESKFRSIRVGMTARQVEEIMGPPFTRSSCYSTLGFMNTSNHWGYSRPNKPLGFHKLRAIWFRDGKVSWVENSYFIH